MPNQHANRTNSMLLLKSLVKIVVSIAALSLFATLGRSAELQSSCIAPPATVIAILGVNTNHANAVAKYTKPDIIKACYEGYVAQGTFESPEECVRQTSRELLGQLIRAEANCVKGSIKLDQLTLAMPVHKDCASGGIFAAPAFQMLCPGYRGKVVDEDQE